MRFENLGRLSCPLSFISDNKGDDFKEGLSRRSSDVSGSLLSGALVSSPHLRPSDLSSPEVERTGRDGTGWVQEFQEVVGTRDIRATRGTGRSSRPGRRGGT